jgi:PTS system ascorbate-specific IIB component
MKILAVCGEGIGTSVLLKMNADRVLKRLGIEALVEATDIEPANATRDAQIFLTTAGLQDKLVGGAAEIIAIDKVFDLEELSDKLAAAIL